jgi:hypothetical protein
MGTSLSGALSSSEDSDVAAWDDTSSRPGDDVEVIAEGLASQSTKAVSAICSVIC